MQGMGGLILGQENSLEKRMASHSSILAQQIPCIEEPGGLESMGVTRIRQDSDQITTTFVISKEFNQPISICQTDFKISVSRVQQGTNNFTSIDFSHFWFLLWPVVLWHIIQQELNYLRPFRNEPKSLFHYCSISHKSLRTAFDLVCVLWILGKDSSKCMY